MFLLLLLQDIHLAKRFYDMAAETSGDAHLPVSIVLFKLHLELLWEKLRSFFSSSSSTDHSSSTTTTTTTENNVDLDSVWDLYLIAALIGFIGALFTMRRQRAAAAAQQQRQVPVR